MHKISSISKSLHFATKSKKSLQRSRKLKSEGYIKNYRKEAKFFKQRLLFASVIVGILIFILLLRLLYLQVGQYNFYTKLSENNQVELSPIEPNRGLIYDRNGVLLAENSPVFSLSIIPNLTPDLDNTLLELQKIINITPENIKQFKKSLSQHQKFEHIPLKLKLTEEETANFHINQYQFPGVTIDAKMIRNYPFGYYTASVLGYVGRINANDLENIDKENYAASNFIGKTGIEKFYEPTLHGKTGYDQIEVDASSHVVRTLKTVQPIPGENLYLTIDINLQKAAQNALGDEKGAIVVINPQNGEILAFVSNPSYDPNLFTNGIDTKTFQELQNSPTKPLYNRAIFGLFPLASNIKPFIAMELLNTGTVNQYTSVYDPGWFKLPNSTHVYWDWAHLGHGTVNVSKAIMESCDTYFYNMAPKLGIERIDQILTLFGFGKKTGVDLNDEPKGIVASPQWKMAHTGKSWYPGDTVISIIGQGFMSTTPLQLAHAVATLSQKGVGYRPHFLLKSVTANGLTNTAQPVRDEPIVVNNPNYWKIVTNAMQDVIRSPMGTAYKKYGTDFPYTIAGKTGGAQLYHHKYNKEGATPEDEAKIPKHLRNHSLFIAFAPVDKTKLAISVVVENNITAPMVARKVVDYYLGAPTPKPKAQVSTTTDDENDDETGGDNTDDTNSGDIENTNTSNETLFTE